MILAVVDDLLFSSKIRTTARQLGLEVAFVRQTGAAVESARRERPRLIVVDLNCARFDAIGLVSSLKQDEELRTIPVVGFVSHVHGDVIDRARAAGIDEVMARSAFSSRLPEILAPPS